MCQGLDVLVEDGADRVAPNMQLADAARLEDFRARLAQEFRRLQPAMVGVARTRKYQNWSMADATMRFGLEAVVLLAAVQEGFEARIITQEEAARTVGVPVTKIAEQLPHSLEIERTSRWKDRAVAYLVARHLAERDV